MFVRKFGVLSLAASLLFSSAVQAAPPAQHGSGGRGPAVHSFEARGGASERRGGSSERRGPERERGTERGSESGAREQGRGIQRIANSNREAPKAEGRSRYPTGAAPDGFQTPAAPPLSAPEQQIHQALGVPQPRSESHPNAVVLSRQGYITVYDPDHKIPLVVSWATTPKDLGPSREAWGERVDVFHEDTLTDLPQATLDDYKKSGYHRGHMVRQGERPISLNLEANQSTFSLAGNILPQAANNNVGPWGHFEDFYRDQVFDTKKVAYVQAGPILEGPHKTIGQGGVTVPSHTYKIVVLADPGVDLKTVKPEEIGSKVKVFAVIIPNNNQDVKMGDHWAQYVVPVSQVAKRTNHPGFVSGFSEETRKAVWNHRPEVQRSPGPDGVSYVVDGVHAKPWVPKFGNDAKGKGERK